MIRQSIPLPVIDEKAKETVALTGIFRNMD